MDEVNNTPGVAKLQRLESEIQALLEKAEEEGECEGWEIDEIALIDRRSYGIKVGIYPWGKTIIYGTFADIRRTVKDIIRAPRWLNCSVRSVASPSRLAPCRRHVRLANAELGFCEE